jgi:hypothetical protein
LTRLPSDPTVRINRQDNKTLNLNLKVKPERAFGGEFHRVTGGSIAGRQ